MTDIELVSEDGSSFLLSRKQASISMMLKTAMEHDDIATKFNVELSADILSVIVDYMIHYNGTEPKRPDIPFVKTFEQVVDKYCYEVCERLVQEKKTKDMMDGLVYMGVNEFVYILGCKIASLLKGKTMKTIDRILENEC